jgi:hypothetical protein
MTMAQHVNQSIMGGGSSNGKQKEESGTHKSTLDIMLERQNEWEDTYESANARLEFSSGNPNTRMQQEMVQDEFQSWRTHNGQE